MKKSKLLLTLATVFLSMGFTASLAQEQKELKLDDPEFVLTNGGTRFIQMKLTSKQIPLKFTDVQETIAQANTMVGKPVGYSLLLFLWTIMTN